MPDDTEALQYPPDDDAEKRRAWFRHQLAQHTCKETAKAWTQRDIAREAGQCTEGQVSLVLGGKRRTGAVTRNIQRVISKVLKRSQADLFGSVCTNCTNCGAQHTPRRVMKLAGDESELGESALVEA